MGRMIAGVVVGYLVMFIAVFVLLTGAYFILGADRAFKPGSYDVTATWLVLSTILSLAAAVVGGWVAVSISRRHKTAVVLAGVVVVLGIILAIPTLNAPKLNEVRDGSVGNTQAMMKAQQPPAVSILNPIIGAIGVMLGARLRGR
jgi:hypothetical protein